MGSLIGVDPSAHDVPHVQVQLISSVEQCVDGDAKAAMDDGCHENPLGSVANSPFAVAR